MFTIFGWERESDILGEACITHCYRCCEFVPWEVGQFTDWLSIFHLNVIPLYSKFHLICSQCGDSIRLTPKQYFYIRTRMLQFIPLYSDTPLYKELSEKIETSQLADKTPAQISFIRASIQ